MIQRLQWKHGTLGEGLFLKLTYIFFYPEGKKCYNKNF